MPTADELLNTLAVRARELKDFRAFRQAQLDAMLESECSTYEEAIDGILVALTGAGVSVTQIGDAMGTSNRTAVRNRIKGLLVPVVPREVENVPEITAEAPSGVSFELNGQGQVQITAQNWGPKQITGQTIFWFDDTDDLLFGPAQSLYNSEYELVDQLGFAIEETDWYGDQLARWLGENA